jgi:hypothetical protein
LDNPLSYLPPPPTSKELFATISLVPILGTTPQQANITLKLNTLAPACEVSYRTVTMSTVIQEVNTGSYAYRGFAAYRNALQQYPPLVSPLLETIRP